MQAGGPRLGSSQAVAVGPVQVVVPVCSVTAGAATTGGPAVSRSLHSHGLGLDQSSEVSESKSAEQAYNSIASPFCSPGVAMQ